MRHKVEDRFLWDDVVVDSAGIGAWHVGEHPDRRMQKHALKRGYDLSQLRARQFRRDDFDRFDYIIVMDEENYHDVMQRMPHTDSPEQRRAYVQKVLRMKDFFSEHRGQQSVPDPYYGGADGFEWALDLIEDGCEGLLNRIIMQRNEQNVQ